MDVRAMLAGTTVLVWFLMLTSLLLTAHRLWQLRKSEEIGHLVWLAMIGSCLEASGFVLQYGWTMVLYHTGFLGAIGGWLLPLVLISRAVIVGGSLMKLYVFAGPRRAVVIAGLGVLLALFAYAEESTR